MATARKPAKPANKVRVTVPPRVEPRTRTFEIDFNRVEEEILEQLVDLVRNYEDDDLPPNLEYFEPMLSGSYCIKEVKN